MRPSAPAAARTAFKAADEDYFADMDGGYKRASDPGVALTREEVEGRNTWIVWTGGNDRFWDYMANNTFGAFDLLKILSSNPRVGYCLDPNRKAYSNDPNRDISKDFEYSALQQSGRSDLQIEGAHLVHAQPQQPLRMVRADQRALLRAGHRTGRIRALARPPQERLPGRSIRERNKYPGVKIGARGQPLPVGSFYGKASGIVGLRLFPNPDFDEAAKTKWMDAIKENPNAFYTDKTFYNNKNLVRPYRVGMSCGFCHVGPAPSNPPKDPENPAWANLNSNPGAQYFWVDRIFIWNPENAPAKLHLPAFPHFAARLARHLVRVDRQHQQPAHHERGLRPGRALEGRRTMEGEARRRRARQQAVQRFPADQGGDQIASSARPVSGARHGLHAARAQGRLGFGRRARRAQSRLSSISACSARNGCCTSAR